jgi:SAM-dependent methyltransferase
MPDVQFHPDERFTVVECRSCGLGFVNPRPTRTEMARFYPPAFYDSASLRRGTQGHRYRVEADLVEAHCPGGGDTPRTLLDIGCANGDFPRIMLRRGWRVDGVEVSGSSEPILDFPLKRVDFSDRQDLGVTYDAITAFAVLEHAHDPMTFFRNVFRALNPGGVFVFLVTNFESVSSRHLFREDVPRHLYFFSENTIRQYLKCTGLEMVRLDFNDRIYEMRPVNWLRYYLLRLLGRQMTFDDLPAGRSTFHARHGWSGGALANLRYAVAHPVAAFDLALAPAFEWYQKVTRSYGILVCVAAKRA